MSRRTRKSRKQRVIRRNAKIAEKRQNQLAALVAGIDAFDDQDKRKITSLQSWFEDLGDLTTKQWQLVKFLYRIARHKHTGPCSVYLIESSTQYKIGISTDPDKRLKGLQNNHPDKLVLRFSASLRSRGWAKFVEQKLHKAYRQYRAQGEWFNKGFTLSDFQEAFNEVSQIAEAAEPGGVSA